MFHVKLLFYLLLLFIQFPVFAQKSNLVSFDPIHSKYSAVDMIVKNFNEKQEAFQQLNPLSQTFYYWTNYCRQDPKRFWDSILAPILQSKPDLITSYTKSLQKDLYNSGKLPLFYLHTGLIKIAQEHANDIGLKNAKLSHTSTDGRTFLDRFKLTGLKTCAGENLASGDNSPLMALVSLLIDENVPSLGHRKAILNSNYNLIGLGVACIGHTNALLSVQDFACSQ